MNSRRAKIIIDIFMTVFVVLAFIRWDGTAGVVYHIAVGSVCIALFGLHVFVHRKWIKAVTRSCFAGVLKRAARWKYITDMLLIVVWSMSVVTGIVAIFPFFGGELGPFEWGRFHGVTARIGLGLLVIHVLQHIPQIKSYLPIKRIG